MKNKTLITLIVLAIVVLLALFVFATQGGFENLYFGDSITGTYSSDVFYEEVDHSLGGIDAYEITCKFDGENVRVDTRDGNRYFSIKGNEYGRYDICFTIKQGDIHKLLDGEVWLDDDYKIYVSLVKNKKQIEHLNVHTVFVKNEGEWYIAVKAEDSDGMLTKQKTEKLDASNTEIELNLGP